MLVVEQGDSDNFVGRAVINLPRAFFRDYDVRVDGRVWRANREMFHRVFETVGNRCVLKLYWGDEFVDHVVGRVTTVDAWRKVRYRGECFEHAVDQNGGGDEDGDLFLKNMLQVNGMAFSMMMDDLDIDEFVF